MNILTRDRKGGTGTQGTEGHVEVEATGRGREGSPPGERMATKHLVICYNSHRKRIWLAMENVVRGQWCGLREGGHTAGEDAVRLLSPAHVIDLSPGWA